MQEPAVTKQGDFGTKVRLERGEVELSTDHSGMQRARVRTVSVIGELYRRKQINEIQQMAAEKLYHDWYYGVASRDTMLVSSYAPKPSKNNGGRKEVDYSERRMDCWQSYHSAISKLEGLGKYFAEGACCHENTTKHLEFAMGLPRQYGIARLREALDTLAGFYGFMR